MQSYIRLETRLQTPRIRRSRTVAVLATLLSLGLLQFADAQQPRKPKSYKGRRIAQTMSYLGAPWLERPDRQDTEEPDNVVRSLNLKPGDVVADIGAGTGYFSIRMARQVAPNGLVLATDVQPQMLDLLAENMKKAKVVNINRVLCTEKETRLPPNKIDLAIMVDVYHELYYPEESLIQIHKALKPNGRLVLVEYRGEDPRVPIKPLHKMTVEQIRKELEPLGFRLQEMHEFLIHQHIAIFTKEEKKARVEMVPEVYIPGATSIDTRMLEFAGFTKVWNEKDFKGWVPSDSWTIRTNRLVGTKPGVLRTNQPLGNFELELQWRDRGGDAEASLLLNASPVDTRGHGHHIILARGKHGAVFQSGTAKWLHDSNDMANSLVVSDEWNRLTVRRKDRRIQIAVNGVQTCSVTTDTNAKYPIGFQVSKGTIEFRKIYMKEL